ncbi:hypothetical protein GH733_018306 [Mirounga leonina]|nr:hypothetical protein GH733_018306 [Mirounga leonina]
MSIFPHSRALNAAPKDARNEKCKHQHLKNWCQLGGNLDWHAVYKRNHKKHELFRLELPWHFLEFLKHWHKLLPACCSPPFPLQPGYLHHPSGLASTSLPQDLPVPPSHPRMAAPNRPAYFFPQAASLTRLSSGQDDKHQDGQTRCVLPEAKWGLGTQFSLVSKDDFKALQMGQENSNKTQQATDTSLALPLLPFRERSMLGTPSDSEDDGASRASSLDPASAWELLAPAGLYHKKIVDHHENPRNVGSLDKTSKNATTGLVGAPACGDVMKLQIQVDEKGKIVDSRFKTVGCGSATASSSLATE